MAKYLIKSTYTTEGTKGLLKEGGSARKTAVAKTVQGMGGKLEVFYFAFGEPDVFSIIDVPDAISAAAISLVINSKGGARVSITPLITPEEIDAASKKSVTYRAPGA